MSASEFLPQELLDALTDSTQRSDATQQVKIRNMVLEALLSNSNVAQTRDVLTRIVADNSTLEPQQLHLSLTNDPTEMYVSWVTYGACSGVVMYWPESNSSAVSTVRAVETTYSAGLFGWNGTIHTAKMTGLAPSTRIVYTVGCPAAGFWSESRSFSAAPVPAANLNSYVCVTADMGTIVPLGWLVAEEIISEHFTGPQPFDMVLLVGDLSYATVDPPNNEVEFTWDAFNIQNEPFASTAPWQTVVGNHENVPGTLTNASGTFSVGFAAFTARYRMPGPESGGNGNFWFSFDNGPVHYASISSEADFSVGAPEWLWLQQDLQLANARRNITPWIIVMLHRPILSADQDEWNSHQPGAPLSAALEPLLLSNKVDVVLQGHQHCYERTQAVFNGSVITYADSNNTYTNPGAPVYIVQGTSGALQRETFVTPTPIWSAVRSNGVYGFGRMTVNGTSKLSYEFVDTDGVVHDSWAIIRTS